MSSQLALVAAIVTPLLLFTGALPEVPTMMAFVAETAAPPPPPPPPPPAPPPPALSEEDIFKQKTLDQLNAEKPLDDVFFDLDESEIRDDAKSIGLPQRGRILNSVQLPKSDLYARGHPWVLWGSSHAVKNVHAAFAKFRHDTGFEGTVVVAPHSAPASEQLRLA